MKKINLLIVTILAIIGLGCTVDAANEEQNTTLSGTQSRQLFKDKELKIIIKKQADVAAIPSTSGLEWYDGKLFAVSDDSPWLFELNNKWELQSKLTLREYPLENGRVPKKLKPDYEALTTDEDNIIVLSSGSKSPTRDYGYVIDMETMEFKEIVLTDFYINLKQLAGIPQDKKINIEAIAATEDDFLIFHRGNNSQNVAFRLEKEDFYSYFLESNATFPEIEVLVFTLPAIEGFISGFSGASYIEDNKSLLLTSSVEATGDAYNDGEILGSFIAYMPLEDFLNGGDLTNVFQPISKNGQPLITKLESLSVKKINKDKSLLVTAASDNDTGVSEFFELILK